MADVATVDEELKQEETAVSDNPESEEASEETPNGVKTYVKKKSCVVLPVLCFQPLASLAEMES